MTNTLKSMLMITLIALLVFSAACGSPAAATTPPAATAAPTTVSAQVVTAVPTAPTAVPATAMPEVPAERTVQLDALYYQQTAEGAKGGTSPIQVRIRPAAKPGELRVGEDASTAALYYYELGRSLRQGDPQEQLDALGYYWQSAILAQAGAYLSHP